MTELLLLAGGTLAAVLGWHLGRAEGRRRSRLESLAVERELRRSLRRAKADLEIASDRREAVESAIAEGILLLDAKNRVEDANEIALAWFDLRGQGRASIVSLLRSADFRALSAEADPEGRLPQPVRVQGRLFHIIDRPLPHQRRLLVLQDRSEIERLERARRDMVANVSHDLRTPLTSMTLIVESLLLRREELGIGTELAAELGALGSQVATLRALADGLVELHRIESGRSPFRLEALALRPLAEEAAAAIQPLLAEPGIALDIEIPEGCTVLAEAHHITRTFLNLLDNARRFAPDRSTIRIAALPMADGERVLVRVIDQGPGIAPRDRERIFERFYRADRARGAGGAGLGLAIARHTVEGHGGRIWAEEPEDGQGASICFTLLAHASPAPAPQTEGLRPIRG